MRKIKHGRLSSGCADSCCLKLEELSVKLEPPGGGGGEEIQYRHRIPPVEAGRLGDDLSIFLSTHDFATLGRFADKVILLNRTRAKQSPDGHAGERGVAQGVREKGHAAVDHHGRQDSKQRRGGRRTRCCPPGNFMRPFICGWGRGEPDEPLVRPGGPAAL